MSAIRQFSDSLNSRISLNVVLVKFHRHLGVTFSERFVQCFKYFQLMSYGPISSWHA